MIPKIYITVANGSLTTELKYLVSSQDKLFHLTDIDYTPTKGDKICLLPGVQLPRTKLKAFNDDHGTKNVREATNADYIFASDKSFNEYFVSGNHWYYKMTKSDLDKLTPYFSSILNVDPVDISDLKDIVEAHQTLHGEVECTINYNWSTLNDIRDIIAKKKIELSSKWDDSVTFNEIHSDFIEEVKFLKTQTIYDVSGLIASISAKNVVIDYEMYGQLKNMLNSNDTDNHVLAMEIMANSNIVESLLFIEMLFKEHSYDIYNCHTRNHVNFKSLCSMISKDRYRFSTELDDIVKSLINFNVLTTDKLNLLMRHYNNEIMQTGNSTYFHVKTITVADIVHQTVNENYTYTIVDDFEPAVIEEETVEEEVVNTESLNLEDVVTEEVLVADEEPSFELEVVNTLVEEEIAEEVIEEEEVLEVVEDTTQENNINPITTEEDGESEIDWF
jgi:hypothetical protein